MYVKLTDKEGRPINITANGGDNVTPNDDVDLPKGITTGLLVGVEGDVAVIMADGSEVVWPLAAKTMYAISARRVLDTGTTASNIIAVY